MRRIDPWGLEDGPTLPDTDSTGEFNPFTQQICTPTVSTGPITQDQADKINRDNADAGALGCAGVGLFLFTLNPWIGWGVGLGCGLMMNHNIPTIHKGDVLTFPGGCLGGAGSIPTD
jgi:hypothetical protein